PLFCCSPALVVYTRLRCRALHSFPTRRSSDLATPEGVPVDVPFLRAAVQAGAVGMLIISDRPDAQWQNRLGRVLTPSLVLESDRSEEHTSELQSPDHLVCRLLLEKKNAINTQQ